MINQAAKVGSERRQGAAPRAWRMLAAVGGCGVLMLAGCGSSSTSSSATTKAGVATQCNPGAGLTKTATTAKYKMVLDVNPSEAMYTSAQVAAQHPTTGEVMLRGQMANMSGAAHSSSTMMGTTTTMGGGSPTSMPPSMPTSTMPMGATTDMGMNGSADANTRHLEVHICSASTGQVVQDAQPTIALVDHTSAGMVDNVSVAVMEGISSGVKDLHYGNNVTMPAGHAYTVTVHLNGDTATFNFTGPS